MEYDVRENEINRLVEFSRLSGKIDKKLYAEYDVKQGLRDSTGKGVLTGLTEISDVMGVSTDSKGHIVPIDGKLYYQGYDVEDLVKGFNGKRFGFEEIIFLLLFGKLPNQAELDNFIELLATFRELPEEFTRDVIMRAPSLNLMNSLQKCVLTLYSYDDDAEDIGIPNVLRQSLNIISKMPLISVYSYRTYRHYHRGDNLYIRNPQPDLSLAENLLQMLHKNGKYTELEAKVLDVALVLHADHGGGNNSTFTTHVVSSSGTDTYSAISASLGSLKGFKHGGANLKVQDMFEDIKAHVSDWKDEGAIKDYLVKILKKETFDRAGLIYGIGHAVYSLSDPRAVILKEFGKRLSVEQNCEEEFAFYERVENIAKDLVMESRQLNKPMCANVDFYSGFVYTMLGLPKELFTPIFAISRISGWSAHRIEELVNAGKIIRPAYKYVGHHKEYVSREDRN
jgi:citrate synthase